MAFAAFKGIPKFSVSVHFYWRFSDGIWYCKFFNGFVILIDQEQLCLLIMGGQFNHLSDFAKNWLQGVYMCPGDTAEIIPLPGHLFKFYD